MKEKKIYQKPVIVKVELIPDEAVLSVCKAGPGGCIILCTAESEGS